MCVCLRLLLLLPQVVMQSIHLGVLFNGPKSYLRK